MKAVPIKEGDSYFIEVQDLGENGEGIGRIDGFTVFIDGGVPLDRGIIKITKVKKSYGIGRIESLIEASPYRINPECSVAEECGGCQIQHIDYKHQLDLKKKKVEDSINRIAKLDNVVIHEVIGMEKPYRYRNKAQFPMGMDNGNTVIGFYKGGTHEIIDTKGCMIQHSVNDDIIQIFKEIINEKGLSIYDEKTGKGLLRHIVTRVSYDSNELMIVIVTNGEELPYSEEIIKAITIKLPQVKSIVQNINKRKTNVILGNINKVLYGKERIIDKIGELKFEISPQSFFQVNPLQTEVLYEKALEYAGLTGKEIVFDVYCGIGTISLFLAQKAQKVYGIEVVEAAIEDARRNAQINGINNAEFFPGKAEEILPKLYEEGLRPDVIVVDPPRKGCDERVLETIANMNPKRIVYVSCKPSTLARDLKYLNELGYKTLEVQPVDMFPHTYHVECIVLIKRAESRVK